MKFDKLIYILDEEKKKPSKNVGVKKKYVDAAENIRKNTTPSVIRVAIEAPI